MKSIYCERQHDLLKVFVSHNSFLYSSYCIFGSGKRDISILNDLYFRGKKKSVVFATTHPSSELLIMSQISILRAQSSDTRLELVALSGEKQRGFIRVNGTTCFKCHYLSFASILLQTQSWKSLFLYGCLTTSNTCTIFLVHRKTIGLIKCPFEHIPSVFG